MNSQNHQRIFDMVTEYEAMSAKGVVAFLEEKAYLEIISYYEEEDQIPRALEVVEDAIARHGFSVELFIKKAQLLIDMESEEAALVVLDDAAVISPADPQVHLLVAEALAYLGRYDEALEKVEMVKQDASGKALSDVFAVEALVYECQEQYERMFFALKVAVLENPRNEEALERLWFCVEQNKNYEESILLHEKVLDRDAYSSVAWYNLGHSYAYMGSYEQAIEAYEYAFLTDDQFEEAYRHCAELCLELKQYRKALQFFQEMVEQFEPDSDVYFNIGQCYFQLDQPKLARKYLRLSLGLDPLNDEVFYYIGECFSKENNWQQALRAYRKAVQLDDGREEYFAALAHVYAELGAWKKAKQCFQRTIELAPELSELWIKYAAFLMEIEEGEQALRLLEEAEEESPEAELIYARVTILLALGRRQEAYYWLGEALVEDFGAHPLLFQLLPGLEYDAAILSFIDRYRF